MRILRQLTTRFLAFFCGIAIFCVCSLATAQDSVSVALVENHKNWGWDSWVMKNNLITIATVPAIGARIMQYDLDDHGSIYVNPSEFGNTYQPRSNSQWPNFGGFKNWPAPQDRWNWPPPPTLDFGAYEAEMEFSSDSASLVVTSPMEQWRAPDLRFQRRTTIYNNTSRVKVEQTIINEGSNPQQWSMWDVTQSIATHGNEQDFENYWVYFPINPNSRYGSSGVRVSANSQAWTGEVAPGIYGVNYRPESKKIFADSHIGWVCYVDERDGFAYAKTFDINEGADYPDDGARVEVWVNNFPYYLEVEVVSPIVDLPANGGQYTFTEDWWAAKVNGPILSVNEAGAVASFGFDPMTEHFYGEFGVFHVGSAQLELLDDSENVVASGAPQTVTPMETFILDETLTVAPEAESARIVVADMSGMPIGVLAEESLASLITSVGSASRTTLPESPELAQNSPNPFNAGTKIGFTLPQAGNVKLTVFDIQGRLVATLINGYKNAGPHSMPFSGDNLASGLYVYRLEMAGHTEVRKMLLIK